MLQAAGWLSLAVRDLLKVFGLVSNLVHTLGSHSSVATAFFWQRMRETAFCLSTMPTILDKTFAVIPHIERVC